MIPRCRYSFLLFAKYHLFEHLIHISVDFFFQPQKKGLNRQVNDGNVFDR